MSSFPNLVEIKPKIISIKQISCEISSRLSLFEIKPKEKKIQQEVKRSTLSDASTQTSVVDNVSE